MSVSKIEITPWFFDYAGASSRPENTGKQYKAPDGTLWRISSVEENVVKLWTVNAWGSTHEKNVDIHEFKATWSEL